MQPSATAMCRWIRQKQKPDADLDMQECRLYRGGGGSLQYLSVHRCEVQFETSACVKGAEATDKSFVDTTWRGTQSARLVLMKLGTNHDPHEEFLRVWSDSDWAGNVKARKSQSSWMIEIDGCPPYAASRMQKARTHLSGEAEYYAAASATSETMSIREILFSIGTGSLNRTLSGHCSSTWHMPPRRCRNRTTLVVKSSSTAAVGETRSGRAWSMYTSEGNRADLGTKSPPSTDCDSRGNGTAWCWNGQKEDGQDEGEQRRAAVQTISGGQGHGGVVDAPTVPVTATRGTESVSPPDASDNVRC